MPHLSAAGKPTEKPFCILDVNEFWSPSGGGVRRYHLEKMAFFRNLADRKSGDGGDRAGSHENGIRHVTVMPGSEARTENTGSGGIIEHVPAFKFPGNWEYRLCPSTSALRAVILRHRPDVIEVGSPYLLPGRILAIVGEMPADERPKVVGFWHSDFPVTYVGRFFARLSRTVGGIAEAVAWMYARWRYNRMDAILVPSRLILERLRLNGLRNLHHVPLGVDAHTFSPAALDESRVADLKAGMPGRLTIFFGHRFAEEKGLRTFLKAYPDICARLGHEPAVVFAGTGPDLDRVEAAIKANAHMRYIGFVRSPQEMAAWYASCHMGLALSGWETFGLSILEAMACGQILIGVNQGAAREHIEDSAGAGDADLTIPVADPKALAEAVEKLWNDRASWQERSRKAVAYAQRLTWERCFEKELGIYREVADKGRS